MVDNTTLNSGSGGDTIASDDIGGVKFQRCKLIHGADGTNDGDVSTANPFPVDQREVGGTAIDVNAGNAGAGTQRVVIATDQAVLSVDDNAGSLTVDGTVTSDAGTGFPSVQTEDAASAGGETGLLALGYRQDADTSPVTLDGDFHGLIFDNAGALKANVKTSALPTGAATAANQLPDGHNVTVDNAAGASAVNIQDGGNSITVDGTVSVTHPALGNGTAAGSQRVTIASDTTGVLSVDDNGANLSVDWGGTVPPIGAGTEAAALRVTLANNSTGLVSVDDGGSTLSIDDGAGSITVDGTVTVTHPALGNGTAAGSQRVTIASDTTGVLSVDDNGASLTVDGTITADAGTGTRDVQGDVAHDAADSGNPVSTGFNAAEFAADPPIVSADGDRVRGIATPNGIQYVLGGHPNVVTREYMTTSARSNSPIIDTVAAGSHVVITAIEVLVGAATSVNPQVRIGFGTASVPAEPASGASTTGIVLSHPGIAAGSGVVRGTGAGVIGVGASDEELRITCDAPTSGQITVLVTYWVAAL